MGGKSGGNDIVPTATKREGRAASNCFNYSGFPLNAVLRRTTDMKVNMDEVFDSFKGTHRGNGARHYSRTPSQSRRGFMKVCVRAK